MVSVASFKSSSIQHDVHFVNYGPIYFKIDNKAGYALGRGYLVINRLLPKQPVMSCSYSIHGCKRLQEKQMARTFWLLSLLNKGRENKSDRQDLQYCQEQIHDTSVLRQFSVCATLPQSNDVSVHPLQHTNTAFST